MKKQQTLLYTIIFTITLIVSFSSCNMDKPNKKSFLTDSSSVDSLVNDYVDNGSYPMILTYLEDSQGHVLYQHSATNKALLPNSTIDKNTWFRIWSMSKIITISIAMDLIEDNLLSLDDPVTKYIPEFNNLKVALSHEGEPLFSENGNFGENSKGETLCPLQFVTNDSVMTVLQLINHKAGFYYATTGIECLDRPLAQKNLANIENGDQLIRELATLPLMQHPGSSHFYGLNTTVLGLVAERASGKTLNQLLEERVTKPLQIQGLRYKKTKEISLLPTFSGKDSIVRYAKKGELDIMGDDIPNYNPTNELYLGGEGMIGTADGYADFLRMLMNHGELNGHRFLEKETVEEIYAPHTQIDNKMGYNGYNLWVTKDHYKKNGIGDEGLWIGGGYEGTHFWVDPKRDFVGVVMSQLFWIPESGYGRDDKIRGEIYQQLFEQEKKQ